VFLSCIHLMGQEHTHCLSVLTSRCNSY
jgi:hypothetical protein